MADPATIDKFQRFVQAGGDVSSVPDEVWGAVGPQTKDKLQRFDAAGGDRKTFHVGAPKPQMSSILKDYDQPDPFADVGSGIGTSVREQPAPSPGPSMMQRAARSPVGQEFLRLTDPMTRAAQEADKAIGEFGQSIGVPGKNPLGAGVKAAAKTGEALFAPVATAVNETVGDPFNEATPDTALGKAEQGVRKFVRGGVDVIPGIAHGIATTPGISHVEKAVLGEEGPESVASLLPFAAPLAGKAIGKIGAAGEALAKSARSMESLPNWIVEQEGVLRDAQGKPIVVHHGTGAEYGAMDKARLGENTGAASAKRGFFFSESPDTAARYMPHENAGVAKPGEIRRVAEGGNIRRSVLKMTNPMVVDMQGASSKAWRDRADVPSFRSILDQARANGHDGVIIKNTFDGGPKDNIHVVFDPSQEINLDSVKMGGEAVPEGSIAGRLAEKPALPTVEEMAAQDPAGFAGAERLYDATANSILPAAIPPAPTTVGAPPKQEDFGEGLTPSRGTPKPIPDRTAELNKIDVTKPAPFGEGLAPREPAPVPAKAETAPPTPVPASGKLFGGARPMSSEAGALGLPSRQPPIVTTPPGTAAQQAASESVRSKIRFGDPDKTPIGEAVGQGARQTIAKTVRKEAPIRAAEKMLTGTESETGPTALSKFAQGSAEIAAQNLYERGELGADVKVPAVEPVLREVVKSRRSLKNVAEYVAAKRALTGYEQLPTTSAQGPPRIPHGFDPVAVREVIDFYEKNHPAVKAAGDAIFETNRALGDALAAADRWTPEQKARRLSDPFYVQFLRDFGEGKGSAKGTAKGAASPLPGPKLFRRTLGEKDAPIGDPIAGLHEHFRRMTAMTDQARLKWSIIDEMRANPGKASAIGDIVELKDVKARFPKFENLRRQLNPANASEDMGKVFDAWDETSRMGVLPFQDPTGPKALIIRDPVMRDALSGGDTAFAHAVRSVVESHAATATLARGLSDVNSGMKVAITGNPAFSIGNFIRDLGMSVITFKNPNDLKMWTSFAKGIGHSLVDLGQKTPGLGKFVPDTAVNEMFRRARVEGFTKSQVRSAPKSLERIESGLVDYYSKHPQELFPRITRGGMEKGVRVDPGSVITGLYEAYRHIPDAVESVFRRGALIDSLDRNGWKPGQALTNDQLVKIANDAQDVSTNFRLGGEWTKFANRYAYNFLNPQVQGVETLRQATADRPMQVGRRALTYYVTPAAALYWYWQSDPKRKAAWDRLSPYRKSMMALPLENDKGDIRVLSLPLSQEAGAPFAATTAVLDLVNTGDVKQFMDVAKETTARMLPDIGVPSVAQGFEDVRTGKESLTGRSVNPPEKVGAKGYAPETVARDNTSKIARTMSGWLHANLGGSWTAAEIDHVIDRTAGPMVSRALKTDTGNPKEAADDFLTGRFNARIRDSRFVNDFYDLKKEWEGVVGARPVMKRIGDARATEIGFAGKANRAIDGVSKEMADLSAKYTAAQEADKFEIARQMDEVAKRGIAHLKGFLSQAKKSVK